MEEKGEQQVTKSAIPIMVQGTHSDAGKSLVATALCRIFADRGLRTAPFKSQNMSLNSYVTLDGYEIGRAQGVQAEAARTPATTAMNPILIKPTGDMASQIVLRGKPYAQLKAGEYREAFFETGLSAIRQAYGELREAYDVVVIEGAGSPAEINLNDRELVNMRIARMTNAPVVLVGDIDRGGVFASLVGTLQLLAPADRARVIGFVINKFRGDASLLQPGLEWLAQYTGKPVLGVLPYLPDLRIDAEDSLCLPGEGQWSAGRDLDVLIVRLPRISNFTDFEPLAAEPDVGIRYESDVRRMGRPDLIVLPGSKNTIEDLLWLKESGWAEALLDWTSTRNGRLIGICGGFQMLGLEVRDPHGVESGLAQLEGLGLFGHRTVMAKEKRTVRVEGMLRHRVRDGMAMPVRGYELHMGVTEDLPEDLAWIRLASGDDDGAMSEDGRVCGTYLHDLFHNDDYRHALLDDMRRDKGLEPLGDRTNFESERETAYRELAAAAERHLDVDRIWRAMNEYASINAEEDETNGE